MNVCSSSLLQRGLTAGHSTDVAEDVRERIDARVVPPCENDERRLRNDAAVEALRLSMEKMRRKMSLNQQSHLLQQIPNRTEPLLWIHLHKAAGSYMCLMANQANEQIVSPSSNCNWLGHDGYVDSGYPERAVTCAERRDYFRTGNFTYGHIEHELRPSDLCWDDFAYGTMLREPTDLIHSQMNYDAALYNGSGLLLLDALQAELEQPSPLPDQGASQWEPGWKYFDNIQTRLLADALQVPAGQINEEHAAKARERLKRFRVVLRVEDIADGYRQQDLFRKLGWQSVEPQDAVNKVSHATLNFTDAQIAWLRELNRHDIALYQSINGADSESGAEAW